VVVVDTESKIKYWNPKAEQIFGWTIGEVLGKSLTEVIIPVQHREMHRVGMKRYLATGEERVLNRTVEITALNKANREFYVALTISATIQNGQPAFIAFIRDIDEQKKNVKELEDKRMQLERSNQQLEQFAHTASHDMKEPIRKILMFTDRVQTDSGNVLTSDSTGYIAKIRTAASRLAEMVDGVLKYASLKGGDMVIEYVELNDVIKNVEADLELLLQQKNAVVKYADMPSLYCAPFMIHQLFYNLINNSLKFSKPEVNPVINISATKISSMQTKEYGLDDSTPHIEVIVEDNGIGFPQEYAETIFKTFARLNPQSKFEGTGLGLSLCKAIVEKHGGIIKANGAENVGAKFTIVLPEFQNEG
jgi:two-component system, LuxR family, sensor kinase FixL